MLIPRARRKISIIVLGPEADKTKIIGYKDSLRSAAIAIAAALLASCPALAYPRPVRYMRNRSFLAIGLALAAIVVVVVSRSGAGSFRGSLLSDQDIAFALKEGADTNDDGTLTAREIRTHLIRIIRSVILGNPDNDINGDGVVNQADTNATIRGFRALLLAVCGNGTADAGEQCDDGDGLNGDGRPCSANCTHQEPTIGSRRV